MKNSARTFLREMKILVSILEWLDTGDLSVQQSVYLLDGYRFSSLKKRMAQDLITECLDKTVKGPKPNESIRYYYKWYNKARKDFITKFPGKGQYLIGRDEFLNYEYGR